jgi:hypothetical protein
MNSTSQILNANFINYEKVFFKKKLVSFNHIPKFEILECEILECDTCQCKKTIVSKWLPSCAHGASGHLQPSLVRKGQSDSQKWSPGISETKLSSIAEIDTEISALSSC